MANKDRKLTKEQLAVMGHRKRILEEVDVKGYVKRIQKYEDGIAVEKYGKKFYELSEKKRREVTWKAVDMETKDMLLWGRPKAVRGRLEEMSVAELIEEFKVK